MRPWVIYVLKCPRTLGVRYVGVTTHSTQKRLRQHISDSVRNPSATYRQRGIFSLLSIGLIPQIEAIEAGVGDGWPEAERRWIAFYRATGARLWNTTDGGDGIPNWGTHEERSAAAKRRWAKRTPEQRRSIAKKALAWSDSMTPEQRSASAKDRQAKKTREQRSAESKKGNDRKTPEQRSAASRHAGFSSTPEQRKAASDRLRNLNAAYTPEQRRENARRAAIAKHAVRRAAS